MFQNQVGQIQIEINSFLLCHCQSMKLTHGKRVKSTVVSDDFPSTLSVNKSWPTSYCNENNDWQQQKMKQLV